MTLWRACVAIYSTLCCFILCGNLFHSVLFCERSVNTSLLPAIDICTDVGAPTHYAPKFYVGAEICSSWQLI